MNKILKFLLNCLEIFLISFIVFLAFVCVQKYIVPNLPMNKNDVQEKKIESLEKENEMYKNEHPLLGDIGEQYKNMIKEEEKTEVVEGSEN